MISIASTSVEVTVTAFEFKVEDGRNVLFITCEGQTKSNDTTKEARTTHIFRDFSDEHCELLRKALKVGSTVVVSSGFTIKV